jgi:ABC-2 type transport system ATP-binding protein
MVRIDRGTARFAAPRAAGAAVGNNRVTSGLMSRSAELLRLQGVDKTIGRLKALNGFDLTVAAREFVALVGPPGSGKTAVLRLAAGLDTPDRGSITLAGTDGKRSAGLKIGAAFPDVALDPERSVLASFRYDASLYGLGRSTAADRIKALLERFDLEDRRRDLVRSLGDGDRRRAEIARAALHRPDLLLLGDVTEGLAASDASALRETVAKLAAEEGMAVLWATTRSEEAEHADQVVVLRRGTAVFTGSAAELRSRQKGKSIAAAVAALMGDPASAD